MSRETTIEEPLIEVCHGPQCSDLGGRTLSKELETIGLKNCVGDCRNQCPNAPLVYVNNRMVVKATPQRVQEKIKALQAENKI